RRSRHAPILSVLQQSSKLSRNDFSLDRLFDVHQDLADAEKSHGHEDELKSLTQHEDPIGESLGSHDRVESAGSEQQSEARHHEPFGHERSGQVADHHKSENQERQ